MSRSRSACAGREARPVNCVRRCRSTRSRPDAPIRRCWRASGEWARTETDEQIAARLNAEGKRTGTNLPFTHENVQRLRREQEIVGLGEYLRQTGMRTTEEITRETGIAESTLRQWRKAGHLRAVRVDHKHWLYEVPTPNVLKRIAKARGKQ